MDRRNISTTARNYNYYLGLHRPTIKGLKWTSMTIVNELQKTAVDCNMGLYIHSEYD